MGNPSISSAFIWIFQYLSGASPRRAGTILWAPRCSGDLQKIGKSMTSPGTWRVRTSTCAYLLITSTVIAAVATLSMTTSGSPVLAAAAEQPTRKIGPGLTRMPPIDFGKPERVVSITPYVPHVASTTSVQRIKRDVPRAAPVASVAVSPAIVSKPLVVVAAEYRAPDIHRVY